MVVVEVNGGLILVIGSLYDVAQAENIFQSPSARGVVVAPSGRGREAMAHEPIAFGRHVGHACHPHIVISGRVIYVPRAGGAGKREAVIGGVVAEEVAVVSLLKVGYARERYPVVGLQAHGGLVIAAGEGHLNVVEHELLVHAYGAEFKGIGVESYLSHLPIAVIKAEGGPRGVDEGGVTGRLGVAPYVFGLGQGGVGGYAGAERFGVIALGSGV